MLCLSSCAWAQSRTGSATVGNPSALPDTVLDESWDPATLLEIKLDSGRIDRDVLRPEQYESFLKGQSREETDVNAKANGYRVQLVSTRNEDEARSSMQNALNAFSEHVYLLFDNPYYKLRVGDCVLRSDADSLQQRAIRGGFSSAWIIGSQVNLHPPLQQNVISIPTDSTLGNP